MYNYTVNKIKNFEFTNKENEDYKYLIWMCNEIQKMNDSFKSARWIGYVLRMVEELGFWDNKLSRDYIRKDIEKGDY